MPQASFAASHLQQCLAYIRVSDLCEANVIMRNLRSLKDELRFQNTSSIARVSVLAYSDAAHSGTYGQRGYLAGLKNIADALTKRNYAMFFLLNNICVTPILPHHMFDRGVKSDSKHGDEVSPAAYLSVCHKHSV
jgi:hypothetical protein